MSKTVKDFLMTKGNIVNSAFLGEGLTAENIAALALKSALRPEGTKMPKEDLPFFAQVTANSHAAEIYLEAKGYFLGKTVVYVNNGVPVDEVPDESRGYRDSLIGPRSFARKLRGSEFEEGLSPFAGGINVTAKINRMMQPVPTLTVQG